MISLIDTPLFLISVPRNDLERYMHPIARCLFEADYFFSLTGNLIEWSLIADKQTADAFLVIDSTCSVCEHQMQAYQIDIPADSSSRIDHISRVLSRAHISIFYLSTYQTDFVFVKHKHTQRVLETLFDNGFEVEGLPTNPDSIFIDGGILEPADHFETLNLKKEFSPKTPLSLVGLNKQYKETWSITLLKALFYPVRPLEFISYTCTSDGVSLLACSNILSLFKPSHLFAGSLDNQWCIQIDLRDYGLEMYGIVHAFAKSLSDIDILYLSTYNTANIIVSEQDYAAIKDTI